MAFATITTVAGAEKVTCQPGQSMECAFTITSESGSATRISLQTLAEGSTQAQWLEVVGERERDLPGSGSEHVTVRLSVPADAAPGRYPFRLRAYVTDDPEQAAESPAVAAEVAKAATPPQTPPPDNNGFPWWIVAVAAVLVLVIGGGVTWFLLSGGPKVPGLTGDTLDVAVQKLDKAGLAPGAVTEKVTGQADAGVVLSQDPKADTEVEKGSEVALTIEAVSVEVPDIVGQLISAASEALIAAGLETGEITKEKRTGQKGGTVLKQTPAPGERALPDTPVALTVVDEVIVVASLVGQTHGEAVKTLAGLGLRVGRIKERRTGGTLGVVLSHTPAANAKVAPGTRIELVLEENRIVVPRVTGQTSASAVSRLKRVGLKPRVTAKFGGSVNKVLAQSPSAGQRVKPGSTVSITVGKAKPVVSHKLHSSQIKLLQGQALKVQPQLGTLRVVPPAEE